MQLDFATLDVFTTKRFEGNPLAVVQIPADLKDKISQAQKQSIAREFNLSETVFMHEPATPDAKEVSIDIFIITQELPFAGHPTIGSAVLARSRLYPSVTTLVTKAGPIGLSRLAGRDGGGELTRARIPHDVRVHARTLADVLPAAAHASHPSLTHAAPAVRAAELRAPVVSIVKGLAFALVRLPSLALLGAVGGGERAAAARLDVGALPAAAPPLLDADYAPSYVGRYYYVVVGEGEEEEEGEEQQQQPADAAAGGGAPTRHIRSRMIDMNLEDPATGSAASALASYLTIVEGRREASFKIVQGVEMGRRSDIYIQTASEVDAAGNTRMTDVWLSGDAVVVQTGRISID